jgi:acetoin utilization protein AcuC
MLPHFYYSADNLGYDFGPGHPLKPERLRRTIELIERYGVETINPGIGRVEDLLRVHDEEYVDAVRRLSGGIEGANAYRFGFGSGDNPVFPGMFEAALSYCSAAVKAAEAVRGGAPLAFAIGGGLHHARKDRASGFCIFDDPAIACHILLEKFDRVAYVDIDVHHGDGVQWIFYDEPRVLTCSIHEEGRSLFPGTGDVRETGAEFTSFNVPMQAHTSGDVWLSAFMRTIPDAVSRFGAQAIVLQMGTDAHLLDPLAHICCTQQHWLGAVQAVKDWGLPVVAVGGGGYNLTTVPRMWVSACLTLGGVAFDDDIAPDLGSAWHMRTFSDPLAVEEGVGAKHADAIVHWLRTEHMPNLG